MAMHEIEIFVMVDENGDYVVAKERDGLNEAWEDDIGGTPINTRVLAVNLTVETAEDTKLSANVPVPKMAKSTMTVS